MTAKPITALPRPDDTDTVTSWGGEVWAETITGGFDSDELRELHDSASTVYGPRLTSVYLKTAPLGIKDVFFIMSNTEDARRERVRRHALRLLEANVETRFRRTKRHIIKLAMSDEAEVEDAREVVAHFGTIKRTLTSRRTLPGLVPQPMITPWHMWFCCLPVVALGSESPAIRAWFTVATAVAVLLAVAGFCVKDGWRHGYNHALWHCAETSLYNTQDAAKQDDAARQAALQEQAAKRGRRMAFKLPRQPRNEGYLYVLEFSTGSIKVGMTEDPRRRLGQHLGEARAFGVYITNHWISPSCHNFKGNETRLINACGRVSKQRSRKEYFHDVAYAKAVGFANELTYFSANDEQTSVEGVWA